MSAAAATLKTRIPGRLDRLPWSRFHWTVLIGLGTVWILDGLEVTMVGNVSGRLGEDGAGLHLDPSQIGRAAAFYVAGACVGALFFGQLTDRFGRKKLFLLTLLVYIVATVATAFAMSPLYFFIARFFTGAGIGGEYAAINSAIDELIPARVRGRVDLIVNGTYWAGAALGALASIVLLNTDIFAADLGWRLAFGLGAVLGVGILIVRRHVPESPRWLFIHGREEEAEQIVSQIEAQVEEEMGKELPEADKEITVRQRERIPFREIARVAFTKYPKRTVLGLSLFIGQAFLYNAITFDLGTLLGTYYKVDSGQIPYYFVAFALGNLLGPLLLGRLFDTVGRKPMIAGTYLFAAVGAAVLALLTASESLTSTSFMVILCVLFFVASAGASSAYLTVSEIFPMETRALAIAFFFAIGTGLGGIVGPLLFGELIKSGDTSQLATGFWIGSGVMALGGIAALLFAVKAEGRSLEDIATPLTADGVEDEEPERFERIGRRRENRRQREERGARRLAPGRPSVARDEAARFERTLDEEIGEIARVLADRGVLERDQLAVAVGASSWGPGRFAEALRAAEREGQVERLSGGRYGTPVPRYPS
ncbi:MAG: MFS transporter [Solirubrobacteraceae bacterium]